MLWYDIREYRLAKIDIELFERRWRIVEKRICSRCVMDNVGDGTIKFEADGTCNYCNYALSRRDSVYFPNDEGKRKIEEMVKLLKSEGKNKEYDCLMGISGGLDSAYLAYLAAKDWGLRILAVHVDDGFDTVATGVAIGTADC